MPTLEQVTAARMAEIADVAESGVTQMTGKSKRTHGREGEFVGRYRGLKPAYPELERIPDSPKQIAAAIRRGKGKVFTRVYETVEREMYRQGFKPSTRKSVGRPTVSPHEGRAHCARCQTVHTKGQHRFHGPGSYHRTHLFSFNPNMTIKSARETFSALMAISKRRSLTAAERVILGRASQVIRYAKRARPNPRKRRKVARVARVATRHAVVRRHSRSNPPAKEKGIVSLGRAVEVRYQRIGGRAPGFYKHEIKTRSAGVFTVPGGSWVYLPENSIVIASKVE